MLQSEFRPLSREKAGAGIEYAVYFLPRRTIACERIFQEQGVYGDIVAGELPISFIPFECDVLSLEMGSAFRVRHLCSCCLTTLPCPEG